MFQTSFGQGNLDRSQNFELEKIDRLLSEILFHPCEQYVPCGGLIVFLLGGSSYCIQGIFKKMAVHLYEQLGVPLSIEAMRMT